MIEKFYNTAIRPKLKGKFYERAHLEGKGDKDANLEGVCENSVRDRIEN